MQLERLREMGYTLMTGFENEFVLFKKGTKTVAHPGPDYSVTDTTSLHVRNIKMIIFL